MSQENSHDKRIPIYALKKTDREEIHFSINYYQNRVYLDIRTWLKWSHESGSRPTSKGVSIPIELWPAFKEGILGLLQQSERLSKVNVSSAERQKLPAENCVREQEDQMSAAKLQD